MHRRPLALAAALSIGVLAPAALAAPRSPQTEAGLLVRAKQRPVDQAANPEHTYRHALVGPRLAELQLPENSEDPQREAEGDPFLAGWAPERGAERDVSILNRYGARLHGHLSMPRAAAGRLPAVILLTGGAGTEHAYREMAQGIAEAGYVVLGLNVQGDNGSQLEPPDPDPSTAQNENEYCQRRPAAALPRRGDLRRLRPVGADGRALRADAVPAGGPQRPAEPHTADCAAR